MSPVKRAIRVAEGWLEMGRPDEAWEELETLAPELRADPAVITMRVCIYLALDRPAEADVLGTWLLSVAPASLRARELVAAARERLGRLEAALEALTGAPARARKDAVYCFEEGRLLVRLGRVEEGVARLARAVQLDHAIRQRILEDDSLEAIWWRESKGS